MEPNKSFRNVGKKIITSLVGIKDHEPDPPPFSEKTKGTPKFCPICKSIMVKSNTYKECGKCKNYVNIDNIIQCRKCDYREPTTVDFICDQCGHKNFDCAL